MAWVRNDRNDPDQRALAHYIMGILYDSEGDLEAAIKEYEEASSSEEEDISRIHIRLAVDYLLLEHKDKAIEELMIAEGLDPKSTKTRFLLALIYASDGKYDAAQKKYEEIVQINPDDLRALAGLADLYVVQEKIDEAALIYKKLLEKDDASPILHFNLGIIDFRNGKIEDAIQELTTATRLQEDYIEAYIALAMLYETKKDLAGAIAQYEKVVSLSPANSKTYYQLGRLYYETGRHDKALRQYELLVALSPKEVDAYIEWANVYLKEKKPLEAIRVLEHALEAGVDDADLYLALGFSAATAHQDDEALAYYQKALDLRPDDPKIRFYIGSFYDQRKQKELAIRELREAIRLDASFAEAYNYLGYIFAEDSVNLDEAVLLIKKALESDPENGAYIDSLGWAYFRKGMLDEALRCLEKAVSLEPDDPVIRDHIGDVYRKKGMIDQAAESWKKSLEIDPQQEQVREKLKECSNDDALKH